MSEEKDRKATASTGKPERFSLRRETLRNLSVKSAIRTGFDCGDNTAVCNGQGPSCNKSKPPTSHVSTILQQ